MNTNLDLNNKTILITGSSGFIGFHLVKKLLNEYPNINIIGLDNMNDYYDTKLKEDRLSILNKYPNFKFIKGSISDKELIDNLFNEHKPDIVVNLAAQAGVRYSIDHPNTYIDSNIVGFYNILEACKKNPVEHLVYASSSSVYGNRNNVPFSEEDRVDNPESLYAASKICDEVLASTYNKLYNIPCTGLRFFTVYGPFGRPDMAYFNFTNKLLNNEKIKVFNNGNCKRDFTYIDDIVDGITKVISNTPKESIYNIGNSSPVDLLEFIKTLKDELIECGLLNKDFDLDNYIEYLPMQKGDVELTYADVSKLKKDFGYFPKTSIKDGLKEFCKWYKDFYSVNKKKIAVAGTGYVGLSLATLLSKDNEVVAYDINQDKVDMINNRKSPIRDEYIEKYFNEEKLNLNATNDYKKAFNNADYVIICTPTNYDEVSGYFDTSTVEDVIKKVIEVNPNTTIVVKSTVPVGFINSIKEKYKIDNIMFSPEFLREGKALYDNLYPSRIIVGDKSERGIKFAELLKSASLKKDVPVKYMDSIEAEAVKLFANTYLALRVSFFNELDTYAELNNLNTQDIIEGVCLDPRIGNHYNNPSFGYGGYCLPKDTRQLLANYKDIPQNLIEAIVRSNDTRKDHITNMALKRNPNVVGIYRLTMKKDSDNFRSSAIEGIIKRLKNNNIKIIIYEPTIEKVMFNDCAVVNDLELFNSLSDVILANRMDESIEKVKSKVYTRDLFTRD